MTVAEKWLNVVLDLNGVLCVCEDAKYKWWAVNIGNADQPHSATVPAIVGPKAVFVRPNCTHFLRELALIAHVSIWSSMKMCTVQKIVDYLFVGLDKPRTILGQESCTTLKCEEQGRIVTFREPGTTRDLFVKDANNLFNNFEGQFHGDNTVIVDDSPMKHFVNKSENVILPISWSPKGNGPRDSYLDMQLLPWLRRLHLARDEGLICFRKSSAGKIGRKMLYEERNRGMYNSLMDAVRVASAYR